MTPASLRMEGQAPALTATALRTPCMQSESGKDADPPSAGTTLTSQITLASATTLPVNIPTSTLDATTPEQLPEAVSVAVAVLSAGDPVALPTETVYGLAADARDPGAVEKIFVAKDRPHHDPLIVHLPRREALDEIVRVPDSLAGVVEDLTSRFWPGPLTLVLPRRSIVPDLVTSGLPTVAVRMSAHPVFRKVAAAFGGPLAAPSANRFGRISPTRARDVLDELDGRIPLIIDGGPCARGVESTIVRPLGGEPGAPPVLEVLRTGPVTPGELESFGRVVLSTGPKSEGEAMAPGQLDSHYAPRTPLVLADSAGAFTPPGGKRCGLLAWNPPAPDVATRFEKVVVLPPRPGDLEGAASRLYHLLRALDDAGLDIIVAESVPESGVGHAIRERLERAALRR